MPIAPAKKLGAWKLAYADFLTALMAFFLVMWLVHGTSPEEKAALAGQFGGAGLQAQAETAPAETPAESLARALKADPALEASQDHIRIEAQGDTLTLDITDMNDRPLFSQGDGRLNETGRDLVALAGRLLAGHAFPLRIEGHTDSFPSRTPGYSNWELSAERANAARRILVMAGVSEDRIAAVSGLAATRPLPGHTADLPANRRITIVVDLGS